MSSYWERFQDSCRMYRDELRGSFQAYLEPPHRELPDADISIKEEERAWLPPGSLEVEGYDHRIASNSCKNIRNDMITCFTQSPCYKQGSMGFESCFQSYDKDWVGEQCLWLRTGYTQCRRDLLNRQRIWQRGNRAAS
eukprot:GEMP01047874.1.p1 GENE.GEMP01047874.1~~GEMP01047874.1.p1  ORF type:complete len:138 (+),score=9.11 GEMP01047874.1:129-542(+)